VLQHIPQLLECAKAGNLQPSLREIRVYGLYRVSHGFRHTLKMTLSHDANIINLQYDAVSAINFCVLASVDGHELSIYSSLAVF
jgi:hypothetical protein